MKPMSLAAFFASMLVLGISLLWFPDLVAIAGAWFPVGTPTFIIDFVAFIPWGALSIILIMTVVRLLKRRGNNEDRRE
jgi:membrane protein implicated in regulation of membrane protease activity